jgi:hypothetical protein
MTTVPRLDRGVDVSSADQPACDDTITLGSFMDQIAATAR